MNNRMPFRLAIAVGVALSAACGDRAPLAPSSRTAQRASSRQIDDANPELNQALATMRAATAPYHDVQNALNDGFLLRHPCLAAGDDGLTGDIYTKRSRSRDGVIDPSLPDGLIYEHTPDGPRLVGIELIMPYDLWTNPDPPTFFGTPFEREDGFCVFGLHVWLWLHNPNGMFEENNPNVSC